MFQNLIKLNFKRNCLQAMGFYLVYVIASGLISGITGFCIGVYRFRCGLPENTYILQLIVGIVQSTFITSLCFLIYLKNACGHGFFLLGIFTAVISLFIGYSFTFES